MYLLSELDRRLLLGKILPQARRLGVSEELRGWSWRGPPVRPYYEDARIPMYLVCSKYCPTHRDVYLLGVERRRGEINYRVSRGLGLHAAVSNALNSFLEGSTPSFDRWWEENRHRISNPSWVDRMREEARMVWEYTLDTCRAALAHRKAEQPYSRVRDSFATALPFLVEHRVSGELLGLSGLLSVDCYDYLRNIVFDLKVAEQGEEWHKLYPTGYAMVLESVYEIPVDIGCLVYVSFKNCRLVVRREIFFVDDELRSWWLEERDKKLEIIAQRKDPGVAQSCPEWCTHLKECRGSQNG
ncbi:MAG: type I-A CRISPR-associated protein Cas4/Csa1 [Methanobacteriota archaeon]|nr:MAG: type I-A CRISPR-associated protein Cas4/Csa1 [Euryarchaeota archaeon]